MEQKQREAMKSLYKGFIEDLIGEEIELKDDICEDCRLDPCDHRLACMRDDERTGQTTKTTWCGTFEEK